jgi:hypothetical protein
VVAKIKADEISSIIKERIDNFELNVDINETGKEHQKVIDELRKDGYSEIVIDHWLSPRNFGRTMEKSIWIIATSGSFLKNGI